MPGNTESPQQNSPSTGVEGIGNKPFPALIAGPYVPRFRRRKRSCVRGVPTSLTSHFSREKPGPSAFSTALHRTCSQQKPAFRSDLLKLTPKYYYPESRYTPIVATSKLAKSWVFRCQAPRYLHSKAYDGWFHNLSWLWLLAIISFERKTSAICYKATIYTTLSILTSLLSSSLDHCKLLSRNNHLFTYVMANYLFQVGVVNKD